MCGAVFGCAVGLVVFGWGNAHCWSGGWSCFGLPGAVQTGLMRRRSRARRCRKGQRCSWPAFDPSNQHTTTTATAPCLVPGQNHTQHTRRLTGKGVAILAVTTTTAHRQHPTGPKTHLPHPDPHREGGNLGIHSHHSGVRPLGDHHGTRPRAVLLGHARYLWGCGGVGRMAGDHAGRMAGGAQV